MPNSCHLRENSSTFQTQCYDIQSVINVPWGEGPFSAELRITDPLALPRSSLLSPQPFLSLLSEEALEGIVVVLIKGCVN